MFGRHSTKILIIYLIYLMAIAVTTALLFFWVLVVQRFDSEINQAASRLLVEWNYFHWFVHTTGVGLFFLVLVALTYLLAVTLSERRYSKKQEEFLSNITHELKSPVAAIKLHTQTLQHGDLEPDESERSLGYILQQAERVGALVDNLLEGSRLSARGHKQELQPIRLPEFFASYQQGVAGRFDLRDVNLRFEIRSRAVVMATNEALKRIMDNLIDNALRFTAHGGEIHCEVTDVGGQAEIVVADTGIGIPKRELGRIFNRFHRLGRELRGRKKGTGLGLAIVRGLVEEMEGRIRAVARDDRPGTRFEIQLPTRAQTPEEPIQSTGQRPGSPEEHS